MDRSHKQHHELQGEQPWWKTPFGIACIFFFVVAGYFLFMEHRAHIGDNWIWLILLACPLMHIFHHGGHGGHSHSDDQGEK